MDTSAFGWPISAPIKRVGSKLYVEARETLSPYGYKLTEAKVVL